MDPETAQRVGQAIVTWALTHPHPNPIGIQIAGGKEYLPHQIAEEVQKRTADGKRLLWTVVLASPLEELLLEHEQDEYGRLRPTDHAFKVTVELVSDARRLMGPSFPKASTSTDSEGGIRLTWTRGKREVRLICAAAPSMRTYVYRETEKWHETSKDVSSEVLVEWLNWLRCE